MIESRAFVLGIFICIVLFLSYFFYTVEGFLTSNTHDSHIHVTETGPIDSIQIRYDGNREDKDRIGNINDVPINISDLVIYDKTHKRIPYWNGQVYFEGGILPGYPVHHLWDDNINSMAHSSGSRANLIVNLNPPQEIGSIQLTNRNDCCEYRIQNYNLVLYKSGRAIGETKLFQLGYRGKTVNYIVLNGSLKSEKGDKGEQGPKGLAGPQGSQGSKGDKGDLGTKGTKGMDGNNGPQGLKGLAGPQGPKGFIGPIGYIGAQGSQGIQGIIGPKGIQGINGIRGEVGNIGTDGVPGGKCFRE